MGFDITGIGSVFDFGSKIIDKIWPNAEDANKAKLEMMKLQQEGAFKELEMQFEAGKAQIEVNKVEAANASVFVAGWRPAAGWVCVMGLFYSVFLRPLISWVATVYVLNAVPPVIDNVLIMELLFGMLGLGALRSYDKVQGTASK